MSHEMLVREIGSSGVEASAIGLGTWAIGGGDWVLGWGPQDTRQSIATIRRAVEHGINWIDTAAVFGLGRAARITRNAQMKGIEITPRTATMAGQTISTPMPWREP